MLPDELREYLLSREATTEEQPFGPEVLVYKVKGKMFATLGFDETDGSGRANLKCDPERAVDRWVAFWSHRVIIGPLRLTRRRSFGTTRGSSRICSIRSIARNSGNRSP